MRTRLVSGDSLTQQGVDELEAAWEQHRTHLRPGEKAERLLLVGSGGEPTELVAPRWLAHLFGLRHKCAHVVLQWESPCFGRMFVLEVRSWNNGNRAGHLDVVGGHVAQGESRTSETTAYREMEEELGILQGDLVGESLRPRGGYLTYEERGEDSFFNAEWCDVYLGQLKSDSLGKIRFTDGEVVGIYLCPVHLARDLLSQRLIPIASALERSLPICIEESPAESRDARRLGRVRVKPR